MKLIACETMRDGVLVAFSFLILGAILIFLASGVLPETAYISLIALVLGIACILIAPITLISTFILTVWPGSKKKMDECEH
jgi:uncharacterized membrane protein